MVSYCTIYTIHFIYSDFINNNIESKQQWHKKNVPDISITEKSSMIQVQNDNSEHDLYNLEKGNIQ